MRIHKLKPIRHLIFIVIGILLTPIAMKIAYLERGYRAFGGELMIPLLLALIAALKSEIVGVINEVKEEWR